MLVLMCDEQNILYIFYYTFAAARFINCIDVPALLIERSINAHIN